MRRPGGYATVHQDGLLVTEHDTFTCAHGNEIVKVPPLADPTTVGGFCRMCMGHICERCADEYDRTLVCVPFETRLETMESRGRTERRPGSFRCGHCAHEVDLPGGQTPDMVAKRCAMCWRHLCSACREEFEQKGRCSWFEKKIDERGQRDKFCHALTQT